MDIYIKIWEICVVSIRKPWIILSMRGRKHNENTGGHIATQNTINIKYMKSMQEIGIKMEMCACSRNILESIVCHGADMVTERNTHDFE